MSLRGGDRKYRLRRWEELRDAALDYADAVAEGDKKKMRHAAQLLCDAAAWFDSYEGAKVPRPT